jgi:hypothetical protein
MISFIDRLEKEYCMDSPLSPQHDEIPKRMMERNDLPRFITDTSVYKTERQKKAAIYGPSPDCSAKRR